MKKVSLLGSPRKKGNSTQIAKIIASALEDKDRLPEGKKLFFIQSQGAPKEMFTEVFDRYNSFLKC